MGSNVPQPLVRWFPIEIHSHFGRTSGIRLSFLTPQKRNAMLAQTGKQSQCLGHKDNCFWAHCKANKTYPGLCPWKSWQTTLPTEVETGSTGCQTRIGSWSPYPPQTNIMGVATKEVGASIWRQTLIMIGSDCRSLRQNSQRPEKIEEGRPKVSFCSRISKTQDIGTTV